MMYDEFKKIVGLEVSYKDYSEVIEPMYMALTMDKRDFCKMIKPTVKEMAKKYKMERKAAEQKQQKLVFIETHGMTPNGCYSIGYYAKLVGHDARTGKCKVRNLTEDEYEEQYKYHTMYWNEDDEIRVTGLGYRNYYSGDVLLVG